MIVSAKGLTKHFERNGQVFSAVNRVTLDIAEGDFVQIIGRSGSGKTTLLQLLTGVQKADEGDVVISGESLSSLDDVALSATRNSKVGYIPQGNSLLGNFTVLDNVCLPYYLADRNAGGDIVEKAGQLLRSVGAEHLRDMYPAQLSGGEQRRVAIARALINDPALLVADEPTSNLDVASVQSVVQLLRSIHERGMTVLVVTHELDIVSLNDRICLMEDGHLKEMTGRFSKKEDIVEQLLCAMKG